MKKGSIGIVREVDAKFREWEQRQKHGAKKRGLLFERRQRKQQKTAR